MKSEWSEKLKSRLEHHEKDAPTGLWENISQEIIQLEHARQHRKQVFWRMAAAVAAINLAFLAPKRSFITLAHTRREARNLATSSNTLL